MVKNWYLIFKVDGYIDGDGRWWRVLETKCVDDNYKMLVTVSAVSVTNIRANSVTNSQKNCQQHKVTNIHLSSSMLPNGGLKISGWNLFGSKIFTNKTPEWPKEKSLFDFRLILNDRKWPLKQKDVPSSEKTPVGILINYNCKFYFSKW